MDAKPASYDPAPSPGYAYLRWLVIAAQAASILITWPLWQVRESPPNLPLIAWSQFGIGWPLLVSLILVLVRPIAGTIVHTLLLLFAISMDQMRIQPEFISLAFLLWGTLPLAAARMLCRAHLIALWFYAGLHKLLSVGYITGSGRTTWKTLVPFASDEVASAMAVAVALVEVALGVVIFAPRLRKAAAWIACVLHLGILFNLIASTWNFAVWPWNVALAFSGFVLIMNWREPMWKGWQNSSIAVRFATVLLLVMPAGYYLGLVDAYLAHCLYSQNKPKAWLHAVVIAEPVESDSPSGFRWGVKKSDLSSMTVEAMQVPFPPAHRLYDAYFQRVAKPGDSLIVKDPRRVAAVQGRSERKLTRDGHRVLRHANNAKAAEGSYLAGQKHGFWTLWFANGQKWAEGTYVADQQHGAWTFWFANGRKWGEGRFDRGVETGVWTFWDQQGNMQMIDVSRNES